MEERRTRHKSPKRYFVDDESEDDSDDYQRSRKVKGSKQKKSEEKEYFVDESENDSEKDSENDSEDYEPSHKVKGSKSSNQKSEPLSEYEKMVQKNKEEKLAFLEMLKMDEVKGSFADAVADLKPKRKKPVPRAPVEPREIQGRSVKLRKNLSEDAIFYKAKAEAYQILENERKHELPKVLKFEDALQEDVSYQNFTKDFSDLDEGTTEPFDKHALHFQKLELLKCVEHLRKKTASYTMAFHPMREKVIIASAGTSSPQVVLWNVTSDSEPYYLEPHTEGILHLKFHPEHPNLIVTSSSDWTIKQGDLVKGVFSEVFKVSRGKEICPYFDFLSANTFLLANRSGNITVVDYRKNRSAAAKIHQCHNSAVRSVSVHPVQKHHFLTCEDDGTVNLWDLRKLRAKPLLQVSGQPHMRAALFSPLAGRWALTTSSDRVCIYDGSSLKYKNSVWRNDKRKMKGYILSRATWLPNADSSFVVGSHKGAAYQKGAANIEIFDKKCAKVFEFSHEKLPSFSPVQLFHPSLPVLAAGNIVGGILVFADKSVL